MSIGDDVRAALERAGEQRRRANEMFRERISRPEVGEPHPIVLDVFFELPEMVAADQELEAWFQSREGGEDAE